MMLEDNVETKSMIEPVKEMLHRLVSSLVESPDSVVVNPIEGDGTVVFEVQVHPDDVGQVIGKKGRTINALRTIVRSSAISGGKKILMELV